MSGVNSLFPPTTTVITESLQPSLLTVCPLCTRWSRHLAVQEVISASASEWKRERELVGSDLSRTFTRTCTTASER